MHVSITVFALLRFLSAAIGKLCVAKWLLGTITKSIVFIYGSASEHICAYIRLVRHTHQY